MRVDTEGAGQVVREAKVEVDLPGGTTESLPIEPALDPKSAYRKAEPETVRVGRPDRGAGRKQNAREELLGTLAWFRAGRLLADGLVDKALEAFRPLIDFATDDALRDATEELRNAADGPEALVALDRALLALAEREQTRAPARRVLRALTAARTGLALLRMDLPEAASELTPRIRSVFARSLQLATRVAGGDGQEAQLVALEEEIEALAGDLQQRLDREVPTAALTHAVERAYRLGRGARSGASIARALKATVNLELSAADRSAVYADVEPLGDKLTDTVAGLFVAGARSRFRPRVAPFGPAVDQAIHAGDERLTGSPFAFLTEIDYGKVLSYLDRFVDEVQTPEGYERLHRALNIVRQIGRVESDAAARVALSAPPEALMPLLGAFIESALAILRVSATVIKHNVAGLDMAALLETHFDALFDGAVEGAGAGGDAEAPDARIGRLIGEELWSESPGQAEISQELETIRSRLKDALGNIEMTDEGREALLEIGTDLKETGKVLLGMAQFFGSLANQNMEHDARKEAIQSAIEKMGLAKFFQTLVNLLPLLPGVDGLKEMVPDWGAMVEACLSLQDRVPPMPWPEAEAQFLESFGVPPEELFETFDREAFAGGTIGQVHRATWRDPETDEVIPVVVKVQRPNVAENTDRIGRTSRLGLLILRELLMLDDQGEVFGNLQTFAKRFLPLLERAHGPFVDALRIETLAEVERENIREYARLLAPHAGTATPELIESRSAGTIITMTDGSGSRLDSWLARYVHRRDADGLVEQLGSISWRGSAEEATIRAARWVHERYGVLSEDVRVVKKTPRHLDLSVQDPALPQGIRLRINRKSGTVTPLADGPPIPRDRAELLASRWAEKAFGLPVSSSRITGEEGDSTTVSVDLSKLVIRGDQIEVDEEVGQTVSVTVDRSGIVSSEEPIPDLTEAAIQNLMKQLMVGVAVPALLSRLHGDPHLGNCNVSKDGRFIILLDYGLVIELTKDEMLLPLRLVANGALEREDEVAALALDLFTIQRDAEPERRAEIEAWVKRAYADALEQEKGIRVTGRGLRALGKLFNAIIDNPDLIPKSSWLHSAKSLLSFSGDIGAFGQVREEGVRPWRLGIWAVRALAFNKTIGRLRAGHVRRQKAERLLALARAGS